MNRETWKTVLCHKNFSLARGIRNSPEICWRRWFKRLWCCNWMPLSREKNLCTKKNYVYWLRQIFALACLSRKTQNSPCLLLKTINVLCLRHIAYTCLTAKTNVFQVVFQVRHSKDSFFVIRRDKPQNRILLAFHKPEKPAERKPLSWRIAVARSCVELS